MCADPTTLFEVTFVGKKNLENCQVPKRAIEGFRGGHDLGYMGLAASTWVPMGARVPVWSPNEDHPSQSPQKGFGKNEIFQVPLNSINQQFQGFRAAHGPGHMKLAVMGTTRVVPK